MQFRKDIWFESSTFSVSCPIAQLLVNCQFCQWWHFQMMILICDYDIMVSKEAIDNDKEVRFCCPHCGLHTGVPLNGFQTCWTETKFQYFVFTMTFARQRLIFALRNRASQVPVCTWYIGTYVHILDVVSFLCRNSKNLLTLDRQVFNFSHIRVAVIWRSTADIGWRPKTWLFCGHFGQMATKFPVGKIWRCCSLNELIC